MFIEKKAEIRIVVNGNSINSEIEGNSISIIGALAKTLAREMKICANPGVSDEELVQDMAETLLDMMKEVAVVGNQ